jgi:NRPS condensation-like uncharacterized protein
VSPGGDEPATLQTRLEDADDGARAELRPATADALIGDPVALLQHLDDSGHFHRDGLFGRIFHRGMVSLRENVETDSLHVSVDDNRVTAHVDDVSPLSVGSGGSSSYSVRRAAMHNVVGAARDFVWLVRGRQGDHACVLDCRWDAPDEAGEHEAGLLDPSACAWSVQLDARVAGTLDEARLREAVRATCGHGERDPVDVVACDDDGALDAARHDLQAQPVPVGDHPPLRVRLARHPDGDVVMLNVNHAAADGAGALQVLCAIASAYAGDTATPAALDFLISRDLPVRPSPPRPTIAARARKRAIEQLRNLLARPTGLVTDHADDEDGYGFHLVSLPAPEPAELAGDGCTTGDVLVAALHLTIGAWNRTHDTRGGRVGVLVPADLRPESWPADTIANVTVTARVSSTRHERARPARVLWAVGAQTARNKSTRNGIALIAGLQRAGMLALWAKQSTVVLQPLTSNRDVDTALLDNLGAPADLPAFGADAGETVGVWFSVPARSPSSLCVGAVTVAGQLHLTFRYPHRLLGPAAARRFAGIYVERLRQVAEAHAA